MRCLVGGGGGGRRVDAVIAVADKVMNVHVRDIASLDTAGMPFFHSSDIFAHNCFCCNSKHFLCCSLFLHF